MHETGVLTDLGVGDLNDAVHRSLKGSFVPLPEQSHAKMILIIGLADLRQLDPLRRAQELLREVIQSDPYQIVAFGQYPGMALVQIIILAGHLEAKDFPHFRPRDFLLRHHDLPLLKGLALFA